MKYYRENSDAALRWF